MTMQQVDVAVIGAGAAGLMAAIAAGRRGRRVVVLDHARQAGAKILISGGGRCNFTNTGCSPGQFWSANPHFCKSALSRYTPEDFLALVAAHRIAWHEKTLGQLFCDGPASAIVAMLLAECEAAGVSIRLGTQISELSRSDRFHIATDAGGIAAETVVLATGGLSIPKMGATGFAYDTARRFGLPVVTPRPALVPFTFNASELARTAALSGVSLDVVATCARQAFREGMVFTHRGISGPAVLQVSSCWQPGTLVTLDLLPDAGPDLLQRRKRERPKAALRTILSEAVPQRLADAFAPPDLAARPIGDVPDRALLALAAGLKAWCVTPAGTEGYVKAEVTAGGVDTSALSSQTMAAKHVPGLFVVGEAVDVTGWLGGYNFQWAWASGWCAGLAA